MVRIGSLEQKKHPRPETWLFFFFGDFFTDSTMATHN